MIDERELGRRLGFPECCIHAWIQDDHRSVYPTGAQARGCVFNFRWNGTLRYYIPCSECISEGPPEGWIAPRRLTIFDDYKSDPSFMLQKKYTSMYWKDGHYRFDGGDWIHVEIGEKCTR